MTGLPDWVQIYADLDDTALAALGNRGLLRRAAAEVTAERVTLRKASDDVVTFDVGQPPHTVRLLPAGPTTAQCGCPVATTCLHILAACLWLRPTHAARSDDQPELSLLDEVLAWDLAEVHRSLGLAAVRRVASTLHDRSLDDLATGCSLDDDGARIAVTWPGSPTLVFVRGGGAKDIVVSGNHSDAMGAAWRLEACVRVFAMAGRAWAWPDDVVPDTGLQPNQRTAVAAVREAIEALIEDGLAHASPHGADRLTAAGQRAKMEGLPLLARRVATAAGMVDLLARRDDSTSDADALTSLANAWALAFGLAAIQGPLPPALVGGSGTVPAAIETLIPLGGEWWSNPTARGLTLWFFDPDSGLTESVTAGRAAGADPGFHRLGDIPLIWTTRTDHLMSGPLQVRGVERRVDGTLSPTSRTTVRDLAGSGLPLPRLASRLNSASSTASLVIPSPTGIGSLDLDEVKQEMVWTIITADGSRHDLRVDVWSPAVDTLTWVLARRTRLAGITVVTSQPVGLWVQDGATLRLVVPTLAQDRAPTDQRLRARIEKLRQHAPAKTQPAPTSPWERLVNDIEDLLTSVTATGSASELSPRQRAALTDRAARSRELGLVTTAAALDQVVTVGTPAAALWATVVINRVADQVRISPP